MKRNYKWLVIAVFTVMVLSGCHSKKESIYENMTPQAQVINDENVDKKPDTMNEELELTITHEKGHYMTIDGTQELLSYDIATPRITKGNLSAIEVINTLNEAERNKVYEAIEGKDRLAEGGLDNHLLQRANEENKFYNSDGSFIPYYITRGYSIQRFDKKILSLAEVSVIYTGGVHGNNFVTGLNIDMQTGEKILLQDITPDIEAFTSVCENEICRQITVKQNEGIEFFENYKEFINEIIADNTFFLTKEAVGFISQEYMLQPFESGTIYFEIPYEQLGKLVFEEYLPNKEPEGIIIENEITVPERYYEIDIEYDVATPILNKLLPGMGVSYMFEETERITELCDHAIVNFVASAITEDYMYEEEWYDDALGGYTVPKNIFDAYSMELFGKTIDLRQFEVNQQLGMAKISEKHECIVLVGDWGLRYPTYEFLDFEALEDGNYLVHVTYGITDYEDEIAKEESVVKAEFLFVPCKTSKYGYIISQIQVSDM